VKVSSYAHAIRISKPQIIKGSSKRLKKATTGMSLTVMCFQSLNVYRLSCYWLVSWKELCEIALNQVLLKLLSGWVAKQLNISGEFNSNFSYQHRCLILLADAGITYKNKPRHEAGFKKMQLNQIKPCSFYDEP